MRRVSIVGIALAFGALFLVAAMWGRSVMNSPQRGGTVSIEQVPGPRGTVEVTQVTPDADASPQDKAQQVTAARNQPSD